MHQAGSCLGFNTELGDKGRILRKLLFEHLDGNHAVKPVVFCFIYIGHASGADFFEHLIAVRNQHPYLDHFLLRILGQTGQRPVSKGLMSITEILSLPPAIFAS